MSSEPKLLDYSHLSIPERILLAQELWESVYDHAATIPLTDAEQQELERRWDAYDTGAMKASPWSEVKQRLLEKMTYAVTLLAFAEADIAEATGWYRQCHPHLESGLLLCLEDVLARIALQPFSFPRINGEFRQAFVHRFPYRIVFRVVDDSIVVVAALHTSRHPRTWIARDH